MSIIKQMDERLANMIAAGEVVERPSSIIKELVENSVDAKSSRIDIFVLDSGLKEIRVRDNGIGMDEVDAKKAFLRHATSKITTEFDLERIKTLGFRGEALAAILSVSKVLLKTRQKNNDAIFLKYEDSKLIESGVTSLNYGTEITISNLFYNTPARLKYIKSEYSEKAAIIDMFDRLALSNKNIRMSLTIDNVLVKETFGTDDYYSLISQIYGKKIVKGMIYFNESFQKIRISGYLASPSFSRSNRKDVSVFINGRYIKNYSLVQSIVEGYHSFLMKNRYPLAIIMIDMDPVLVDVNVHPQKLEVKLSNESILKYQLNLFIKNALSNNKQEIPENLENVRKSIVEKNENEKYIKEELDFIYDQEHKEIETIQTDKIPDLSYIGTLAGTYLLFQNEQGMYMVDQHAAEERINYEHYYEIMSNPLIIVKNMIIPRSLNLAIKDHSLILEYSEELKKIGFSFDEKVNMLSHPSFILDSDIETSLSDILFMLEETKTIDLGKLLDQLAKDKSCKASIKANHQISRLEIDVLIKRLRNTKNPYTCPHGRPTIIKLSYYEIERMFKRIV